MAWATKMFRSSSFSRSGKERTWNSAWRCSTLPTMSILGNPGASWGGGSGPAPIATFGTITGTAGIDAPDSVCAQAEFLIRARGDGLQFHITWISAAGSRSAVAVTRNRPPRRVYRRLRVERRLLRPISARFSVVAQLLFQGRHASFCTIRTGPASVFSTPRCEAHLEAVRREPRVSQTRTKREMKLYPSSRDSLFEQTTRSEL